MIPYLLGTTSREFYAMYVREKKIRRGEKTYSYWQVVQGTRVDGKVRQRVVAHLGAADSREQADSYARAGGILCGVPSCGQPWSEEVTVTFTGPEREEGKLRLCVRHRELLREGGIGAYPFDIR